MRTLLFNQSNSVRFTQGLINLNDNLYKLGKSHKTKFANGEVTVVLEESVRNQTIVIVSQPTNYEDIFELLSTIDAARRSSAMEIIAIIPSLPHSRQERREDGLRTSITAKLFADMLQTAGLSRLITMDVHTTAIEGFYNIPFDNLDPHDVFVKAVNDLNLKDFVVASPDFGALKRTKRFVKTLGAELAVISKERLEANKVAEMTLIGNVEDKDVVIFDDMIDTGGTLRKATKLLKENGAKDIYVFATHGIFSNEGDTKLINEGNVKKLFVANTLPQHNCKECITLDIREEFNKLLERILRTK